MNTVAASVVSLSSIMGGWPNLFQGLISAIITGFVAALVSIAVVKLTDSSTRKLSRQQEARTNLIQALDHCIHTFMGVPDERPWRKDLEDVSSLALKLRLAAALVAEQDKVLAQKVQNIADRLSQVSGRWRTNSTLQADTAAPQRYDEAWKVVEPLHETVVNWLGNIKPVYRHGGDAGSN